MLNFARFKAKLQGVRAVHDRDAVLQLIGVGGPVDGQWSDVADARKSGDGDGWITEVNRLARQPVHAPQLVNILVDVFWKHAALQTIESQQQHVDHVGAHHALILHQRVVAAVADHVAKAGYAGAVFCKRFGEIVGAEAVANRQHVFRGGVVIESSVELILIANAHRLRKVIARRASEVRLGKQLENTSGKGMDA